MKVCNRKHVKNVISLKDFGTTCMQASFFIVSVYL